MGRLLLIVNPRSGKIQIKSSLLEILDLFTKGGWETEVYITQAPRDATRIAAQKGDSVDMLVCSGGDGTLSETISGMMKLKKPPLLGYIPAGSTNDFASGIQLSSDVKVAVKNILSGLRYPIDIGYFCEERYFVYMAGFGAFTEVSYQTTQEKKNLLGHQAYMIEGVKSLANLKAYRMKIEAEDFSLEGDFLFGMITNTISVGGFKGLVTRDVALNDGLFEVLMIRMPKTPIEFSSIVSYLFLKEEQNEFVYKFKTSRLHILSEEPIDWVLDGEFGGTRTEVEVVNLSKQIEIMTGFVKKS
ncbi:MAG: YegS/Rv2252/BmrU family lipid kinase [Hungatella sp.]